MAGVRPAIGLTPRRLTCSTPAPVRGSTLKSVRPTAIPHGHWERESLSRELASKQTVTLHEFPFYQESLTLSAADAAALRDVVLASDSFRKFGGFKACGGFHPDYCVEWRAGKSSYQMLLCFGCSEARLFGPRHEVYCDLQKPAKEQMEKLLQPYRKNRPATDIR
jgi:hypothetical protein